MDFLGLFKKKKIDRFEIGTINTNCNCTSCERESALSISTVLSCVRLIAYNIGTLPLKILNDDNSTHTGNEKIINLLTQRPNSYQSSTDMMIFLVSNILLHGNAYFYKVHDANKKIISLIPLQSDKVKVNKNEGNSIIYLYENTGGGKIQFEQSEVWHISGFGVDGFSGLSVTENCKDAIQSAKTSKKTVDKLLSGIKGVLHNEHATLTHEQQQRLRENTKAFLESSGNSALILETGFNFKPLALNNDQVSAINNQKFSAVQLCQMFGVPPVLVGIDAGGDVSEAMRLFMAMTVAPICSIIENNILANFNELKGLKVKFDLNSILRGDFVQKEKYFSTLVNNGIFTRNEVRKQENLTASKEMGADSLTVQSALIDLDRVGNNYKGAN